MRYIKSILIFVFVLSFLFSVGQKSPCPQPTDSLFLSYYQKVAQNKVDLLGYRLSLIVDRTTDPLDVNDLIESTIKLFIDENAQVQVSNVRSVNAPKPISIRRYLNNLKVLRTDKIVIEWTSIQYVSDLRLADDGTGNYHGVISFEQKFSRTRDGRFIYGDLTRKNVLVILKQQPVPIDGKTYICWDVYLSDIEVKETRHIG